MTTNETLGLPNSLQLNLRHGTDPKKLWKQLRSTEQIRKMAQNVWCILNPMGANQPLSMVVAPDECTGERQEYSQKTNWNRPA